MRALASECRAGLTRPSSASRPHAALGAQGTAPAPAPSRARRLALVLALGALAFTAPAAGHSGTHSPPGLLIWTDTLHVLSMGAWLGGLVIVLAVAPAAFRALHPSDRVPLRARVLSRFSRLAMAAVALLLASGAVQAVALVGSFAALVETAYGRLVLAKILLLAALITVGAYNQRRLLPRLGVVPTGDAQPARAAALLRRSVALEIGIAVIVLATTSVLVTTEPVTSN